jgi:hypothetical protein
LAEERSGIEMLNLSEWGMYERDGVLIQPLGNRQAMQVRLGSDHIDVRFRRVPIDNANDTTSATPEWTTAYGFTLGEWISGESPVWQWLREKGVLKVEVMKRQMLT